MEKDGSRFAVVGIGELLWDELPAGRRIGGAPANYAYHCQVLGANAYVVSTTGDDEAGREITKSLERQGLQTAHVSVDQNHPTGSAFVILGGDGVPEYVISENVAWDFIPQTTQQLELASQADAVSFGTLAQRSSVSHKTIGSFLKETRPTCLRIFDVNFRQAYYNHQVIGEALGLANVLKLNESELATLARLLGMDGHTLSLLDELATTYSLKAIALTLGERGCIIRTDQQLIEHDGFSKERMGDTVGAGDCFSAVLTMGLLRGDPLDSVAEQANWLASYVCTQVGAMPEMP